MTRVYLAGPVQHADDGGHGWREQVKRDWPNVTEWADPLDKYDVPAGDVEIVNSEGVAERKREEGAEIITHEALVEADKESVAGCEAVLARYDAVPMAGTPMEILYAHEREIPVVVWDDSSGTVSPWIRAHAWSINPTLESAIETLEDGLRKHAVAASDDGNSEAGGATAEDTAASVAEDAAETLHDRASHGGAVENHEHIAALWSALLGHDVSARQAALCMILVKMSRSEAGEAVRDHDVDICGYAGIARACTVAESREVGGE